MRKIIGAFLIATTIILGLGYWYASTILKPFPKPTGPYGIGTMAMELKDPSRKEIYSHNPHDIRDLMVRFWFPADLSSVTGSSGSFKEKYFYLAHELPYLIPQMALHYHIPQWIARLMLKTIETHAYKNVSLATDKKSYPVILFSHGFLSAVPDFYITILEELASHGYIVVAINHAYLSSITLYPDGKVVSSQDLIEKFHTMSCNEQLAFQAQGMDVYKADMQFVLDQLAVINKDPKSIFYNRLDLNAIVLMGHSAGGTAAIETCRIDTRCKAGINLDGWFEHVIGWNPLKVPLLLMFSGSENAQINEPHPPGHLKHKKISGEKCFENEYTLARHKKQLCPSDSTCQTVYLPGTTHVDFSVVVLLKWPLRSWHAPDSYDTIRLINIHILNFLKARISL